MRRTNNTNNNTMPNDQQQQEEEELLLEDVELLERGEEDDDEDDEDVVMVEDSEFWALRIKSNIRDVRIQVRPDDSVGRVKEAVLTALGEPVTRYLRLVCKGRLLAPDPAPLKALKFVQANDVLHAVLSSSSTTASSSVQAALQQGTSTGLSRRALRSAGINASGLAVRRTAQEQQEEDDEEENDQQQQQQHPHRGFDRLRALGLRRAEITALRSYFSRQVDRFIEQQQQIPGAEPVVPATETADPLLRRQMQEEAWMQSQGPLSEFRLNLPTAGGMALMSLLRSNNNNNNNENGSGSGSGIPTDSETLLWQSNNNSRGSSTAATMTTMGGTTTTTTNTPAAVANFGNDRDFLCGFLLGFFVGFIMLVWVWMPTVPHRQKLGILTGITVQLALGMLRPTHQHDDDDPDHYLHGVRHSGYAQLLRGSSSSNTANTNTVVVHDTTTNTDDGIVLG